METMNEYAARNTYRRFLERLGAKNFDGADEILLKGNGYSTWVKRIIDFVDAAKLDHSKIGKQFAETLVTKPYDTMDRELCEFFGKYVDENNFTQSMDEILSALEDRNATKWNKLMRKWFPATNKYQ